MVYLVIRIKLSLNKRCLFVNNSCMIVLKIQQKVTTFRPIDKYSKNLEINILKRNQIITPNQIRATCNGRELGNKNNCTMTKVQF
jgi:hypothetical protein